MGREGWDDSIILIFDFRYLVRGSIYSRYFTQACRWSHILFNKLVFKRVKAASDVLVFQLRSDKSYLIKILQILQTVSSFLMSLPLPSVSVIGWPNCFQTNFLYDFGGLKTNCRETLLCTPYWQGLIWDSPCKYHVLRNPAGWLAETHESSEIRTGVKENVIGNPGFSPVILWVHTTEE